MPAPRQGVTRPAGVSDDEVLRSSEVSDTVEDDYRRSGTVALSAIRPSGETEAPEEPPPQEPGRGPAAPHRPAPGATAAQPRRKRRRRVPVGLIVTLAIVFLILAGGWMATRAVYFVGTDPRDDRTIAVFRGCPTTCRSGSSSTRAPPPRA